MDEIGIGNSGKNVLHRLARNGSILFCYQSLCYFNKAFKGCPHLLARCAPASILVVYKVNIAAPRATAAGANLLVTELELVVEPLGSGLSEEQSSPSKAVVGSKAKV
jgi:hypothetical protein